MLASEIFGSWSESLKGSVMRLCTTTPPLRYRVQHPARFSTPNLLGVLTRYSPASNPTGSYPHQKKVACGWGISTAINGMPAERSCLRSPARPVGQIEIQGSGPAALLRIVRVAQGGRPVISVVEHSQIYSAEEARVEGFQ